MSWLQALVGRVLPKGLSRSLRQFRSHNERHFRWPATARTRRPEVLFEVNAMHSAHIAYSYLANVLSERYGARIVGYLPSVARTWQGDLRRWVKRALNYGEYGAYASFGTTELVVPTLTRKQAKSAEALFTKVFSSLRTALEVEAIQVNGVWIGDLVFDAYLREFSKPTIVTSSPEFARSLRESIECYVFWDEYFTSHDVRAVNVSHCVYRNAIPLRVAVSRNIPAYQINLTHAYRLDSNHLFAYTDFHYFRNRFVALPSEVRSEGVVEARKRIDRRFSGEVGVDMSYSTKSAFGSRSAGRLLRESGRTKVLIAAHCFFDSPHSYGNNLFPDFYHWMEFLGQMTDNTDYDWYIKTHPDFLPGSRKVVEDFVARYPRLTLLPASSSHHQIIEEGLDVALTVHGTIGFEYAALGVTVINASRNNPHIAYDFNVHAVDVEHYRQLLLHLNTLSHPVDLAQVYEYYFMAFIHNTTNIFLPHYDDTIRRLGGYARQFTPAVYREWLEQWTPERHQALLDSLRAFVESGDFRMDERHIRSSAGMTLSPAKA